MAVRTPITKEELDKKISEISPLGRAFDLINMHIVITDEHGNILYMNHAAEEKTGFTKEEALGKNPGDLWGGLEDDEYYRNLWTTIKTTKKAFVSEVRNKKKDGTEIVQQINITPILDESGNITHYVAIEPDITAFHNEEHEMQNQVDLLFKSAVDRELKMSQLKATLHL